MIGLSEVRSGNISYLFPLICIRATFPAMLHVYSFADDLVPFSNLPPLVRRNHTLDSPCCCGCCVSSFGGSRYH